jgi:hypothetical protein
MLIASAAAVLPAVAGLPALATVPDPIFAAIEKYRATNASFLARCRHEDDQEESSRMLILAPDDHQTPEMVAIVTASIAARSELANTSPTTLAGLASHLEFVLSQSDELGEFLFESEDVGEDQIRAFVRSLERAARRMAAEQAVRS